MVANLTILALTASLLSHSPMLVSTNKFTADVFNIKNANTRNFITHFLYAKSNKLNAHFSKSSFSNYLNTPLHFQDSDNEFSLCKITHQNQKDQHFDNCLLKYDQITFNVVVIMDSTFTNCLNPTADQSGGAIFFEKDGQLNIHGTLFKSCTSKGNGGAIFACKKVGSSGWNMGHECAQLFHSHYCCYSNCLAQYGSAAFVASQNLELNYSSTVGFAERNEGNRAVGAQFDLIATGSSIGSEFINATGGYSTYCAGVEYRGALTGFFRFQTLLDNHGCYISTFTGLASDVGISYSNYINNELIKSDQDPSLIFIREKSLTLTRIAIKNVKVAEGVDKGQVHFVQPIKENGQQPSAHLIECSWAKAYDIEFSNLLPNSTKESYPSVDNEDDVNINELEHLKLDDCQGELVPPTREDLNDIIEQEEASSPVEVISSAESSSSEAAGGAGGNDSEQTDKDTNGGFPVAAIGGIVAGAAAIAAGVAAFFIIRRKRLALNAEDANQLVNPETNAVTNDNPLYNQQKEDDPFQDDFNAEAL